MVNYSCRWFSQISCEKRRVLWKIEAELTHAWPECNLMAFKFSFLSGKLKEANVEELSEWVAWCQFDSGLWCPNCGEDFFPFVLLLLDQKDMLGLFVAPRTMGAKLIGFKIIFVAGPTKTHIFTLCAQICPSYRSCIHPSLFWCFWALTLSFLLSLSLP